MNKITPEEIRLFHERNKLGSLEIEIPFRPCKEEPDILSGKYNIDLKQLYEGIVNYVNSSDVLSVCLFGTIVYRHFTDKKFVDVDNNPYDVDIMTILKNSVDKVDVVIPKKVIKPETERVQGTYGDYDIVKSAAVQMNIPFRVNRSFLGALLGTDKHSYRTDAASLHIDYRSEAQFRNGIGHGDTVSEGVAQYGIPIIGQERFAALVKDIKLSKEKPLHQVEWSKDSEGRLQGRIL